MKISAEEIKTGYELPAAIEVEVQSCTFNEKEFWVKIKHPSQSTNVIPSKVKKNDLLSSLYEQTLGIFHKCLESRVVGVDDVSAEKFCLLHAILSNSKCDWAKHIES